MYESHGNHKPKTYNRSQNNKDKRIQTKTKISIYKRRQQEKKEMNKEKLQKIQKIINKMEIFHTYQKLV